MTAQEELNAKLKSIRRSMELIDDELTQKFDSLAAPDWSDVGDLIYVDNKLRQVWEWLAEID